MMIESRIEQIASDIEVQLLRRCMGGCSTKIGTRTHATFENMAERGLVKEVSIDRVRIWWKLSGYGLHLAYTDDESAPTAE